MEDNNLTLHNMDINLSRKISKDKAVELQAIPFKIENNKLLVLTTTNEKSLKELEFLYDYKIEKIYVSKEKLDYFIDKSYFTLINNEAEKLIIEESINLNVSDLHFEPGKEKVIVRVRIDGILHFAYIMTKDEYSLILSRIKINAALDITEHRKPQDGKVSLNQNNKNYDLRISLLPTIFGEKTVIRILYTDKFNYSISKLNLIDKQESCLKSIINRNNGLVIVNGPTGSGKSTTLYSILNYINKADINIVTIEDPVEIVINGVNQVMINSKDGLSFADGLRSIMRQDPDVIMVGEIRDEETASMAVRSALTGHKVYSTIHCKSPRDVYFRLEDMGVKSYLIKDSLVGIISQRLIRTLCNNCKQEENIFHKDKKYIIAKKGSGCSKCNYSGYRGRALVAALYEINKDTIKDLQSICDKKDILSNIQMLLNLNYLIISKKISKNDYLEFLEKEGLLYLYEQKFKDESKI